AGRDCRCAGASSVESPVTVKLRLTVAALLLFLVVMVDFTSRIMSVLADGVLVCGIVVLLWPVIKRNSLHNA
ncbi:DUF3927 family protein, partial [Escherichia coli]|uniref:DUF3927 family protein n=1 Tax=Escherichia coli TaxID=562 RepID=UPI00201B3349